MKRIILAIIFLLTVSLDAHAQTSAVTATITDSDTQTWNNGTYIITFVPPAGNSAPPVWNGSPMTPAQRGPYTGSLSGAGVLTVSLPDNAFVTPPNSQWLFTLCSDTSAGCSQVQATVTGATPNLSTTLSNGVTAPRFAALGTLSRGYLDGEVSPTPVKGQTYYNVTSGSVRLWNGSAWTTGGGAGSSAFNAITSGTNTTAAMVCGTGCSISTMGSGTITATNGISGLTTNLIPVATSATSLGNSSVTDNGTTVSTAEPIATTSTVSTGSSPPAFTVGTGGAIGLNEGTASTGLAGADLIFGDSTNHCAHANFNNVDKGCLLTTTGGLAFPITVSGTVNSGGVPYFNSTTQMSSSALLTANSPVLGGGAGAAPSTATFLTTNGTNELDIGIAAGGNGVLGLNGNTSGKFTWTAPSVAGTSTNPVVSSNVIQAPNGSPSAPTYGFSSSGTGMSFGGLGGNDLVLSGGGFSIARFYQNGGTIAENLGLLQFGTSLSAFDTGISRVSAGVLGVGNGNGGDVSATVQAAKYSTATNCSSSASPAVCGSASAGSVALPTGTNPTLVVNTTAVTANSQIFLNVDEGLGTKLSVTCNTTLTTLTNPVVTARTAGTSFTFTIGAVIATNPACLSYLIIN